jgi:hypothetical protein
LVPPFLNGRAVFANKHALALAHASEGGKCKGRGISHPEWNGGRPKAGLHKRSAEDCGTPLARARSRAPQEGLVSLLGAERMKSHLVVVVTEKRSRGKTEGGLSPCARFRGRVAAVHPEVGGASLGVQHEEDGANTCTCADESIRG